MTDFKTKMHQIRFRPQTPVEELTAFHQTPLAGFKGSYSVSQKIPPLRVSEIFSKAVGDF